MEPLQGNVRNEMINAFARLVLFASDELEPVNEASLNGDMETVYAALARIELTARKWLRSHSS